MFYFQVLRGDGGMQVLITLKMANQSIEAVEHQLPGGGSLNPYIAADERTATQKYPC